MISTMLSTSIDSPLRISRRTHLCIIGLGLAFSACACRDTATRPSEPPSTTTSNTVSEPAAPRCDYPIDKVRTRWTKDIEGCGELLAIIETSAGALRCTLYELEVPRTVDHFVALALGLKSWKDPLTGEQVQRPLYQDLVFHRLIPGLIIQTGDPTNTGEGHPGYFIDDEIVDGLSHDAVGVLSMAQTQPNGNGSQFFITDGKAKQLDGRYTIFGRCEPEDLIHAIANAESDGNGRPLSPTRLIRIRIERAPSEEGAEALPDEEQ
jgi:peptidyl-prolyl cis-trans isomerase A (cyclophilin A)